MARYNKSALRQQRTKYYEAIEKINNSISKIEIIKDELDNKNKYDGVNGIDDAKRKIETTISDLYNTKAKLNSTINTLTQEINKPDEELNEEKIGGEG